jgi:dCTP diphosphatase
MPLLDVSELQTVLRDFASERDWEQFHTPKNLSMALAGEAGELVAVLQWMSDDEARTALTDDERVRRQLSDELADVLIYLVRLADVAGIDLDDAVASKVESNALRYAADDVRGSIEKR